MKTASILLLALCMAMSVLAVAPSIVLSPSGTTVVDNSVASYRMSFTNNSEVVGGIDWFNGLHSRGTFPVPGVLSNFFFTAALKPGYNAITIIGTNNWATGTVEMVACTNTAWVKRTAIPAEYTHSYAACQTGTVSQYNWTKVSIASLDSRRIDTNATFIIPMDADYVEVRPLAGDTASVLYVTTATDQVYRAAAELPDGTINIVDCQAHPFVANYLTPFVAEDGMVYKVFIKSSATNSTFQVLATKKRK